MKTISYILQILQSDYTLGRQLRENTYHTAVIRGSLNRKLESILPDMIDELVDAVRDGIDEHLDDEGSDVGSIFLLNSPLIIYRMDGFESVRVIHTSSHTCHQPSFCRASYL